MTEFSDEAAAIIGASGNVGFHLLVLAARACGSGELKGKVKAVSREPEQLKRRLAQAVPSSSDVPNLEVTYGDVTKPDTLDAVLKDVKRVFVCLPQSLTSTEMVDYTKTFVDTAVRQGVRHIVRVSSYGIDFYLKGGGMPQGPLGNAHVAGEEYNVNAGVYDVSPSLVKAIHHVTMAKALPFLFSFMG